VGSGAWRPPTFAWTRQGNARCGPLACIRGKGAAFLAIGGGRTLIMTGGKAYTNLAFGGRTPMSGATVATGGAYSHDADSSLTSGVPQTITITALSVDGGREE